jgi:hypothetical protein|tara:strand:+ start:861 stop:998 length:138 start_codon:yes stop_codon:yes gene_type:complete
MNEDVELGMKIGEYIPIVIAGFVGIITGRSIFKKIKQKKRPIVET